MRIGSAVLMAVSVGILSGCTGQQQSVQETTPLTTEEVAVSAESSPQLSGYAAPSAGTTISTEVGPAMATPAAPAATQAAATPAVTSPSAKQIQQALKNAGFYQGAVDGKVGPKTQQAIKTFQSRNGLRADGVVGRRTWEKLSPYLQMVSQSGAAEPATQSRQ